MPIVLPETTKHVPVCYAYSRVSTAGQAQLGMSLADQKERLEGYYANGLKAKGILWGDLYVDAGVSAAKIPFCDRKAGRLLSERIRPGDHIIMTSLDRGFRRLRDACAVIEEWNRQGIHVHFLNLGLSTDTPTGRLVIHILGAIAEFQRDIIVEGVRMGLARRKELCGSSNGRCKPGDKYLGTGKDARIVPDPRARAVATLMLQLIDEGFAATGEQFYWEFRSRGMVDRKGREWSEATLKRLIRRCKLEQWQDEPAVLPPVRPTGRQVGPQSADRVIKVTAQATTTLSSSQPDIFSSETPATDATTSLTATPS